jgi:putative addiction module component (TIGR02574 family)
MKLNKEELLLLPAEERLTLAEELWGSVEDEVDATDDEILFAEERLKMHEENPAEGLSIEMLKKYFNDKYGF